MIRLTFLTFILFFLSNCSLSEKSRIWNDKEEKVENQNANPPKPEDFAKWFETNNSVDLRALLRDIEIVFIEAALDRNSGNTSEASKDLKLLRTTLIEKIKKYSL